MFSLSHNIAEYHSLPNNNYQYSENAETHIFNQISHQKFKVNISDFKQEQTNSDKKDERNNKIN